MACDNVETMIHVIASIRVKEGALDEYVAPLQGKRTQRAR